MQVTVSMREVAVISRCGLLEILNKFVLAFDETFESVSSVGGSERVRLSVIRNDSNNFYRASAGFPIGMSFSLIGEDRKPLSTDNAHLTVYLWLKKKTGELVVEMERGEVVGQDHDEFVVRLSRTILELFQERFATS